MPASDRTTSTVPSTGAPYSNSDLAQRPGPAGGRSAKSYPRGTTSAVHVCTLHIHSGFARLARRSALSQHQHVRLESEPSVEAGLEDVQPIRRAPAAARPGLRARGFVVFSPGHATGRLGADTGRTGASSCVMYLCFLSLSNVVSAPTILVRCVCAVVMGSLTPLGAWRDVYAGRDLSGARPVVRVPSSSARGGIAGDVGFSRSLDPWQTPVECRDQLTHVTDLLRRFVVVWCVERSLVSLER